jgi:hypothetical protein
MATKEEARYDVVICEDATGKIVSVIGTNLKTEQMERRIETGLMRIDPSKFHVKEVEAGKGVVGMVA